MNVYDKINLDNFIIPKVSLNKIKKAIKERMPILLYGKPGVGKTSIIYLIADDLGYDVIETNASDSRRKVDLEPLYESARSQSLIPSLYLFDEVDGMSNWATLEKIIKISNHPIVLTANEYYKIKKSVCDKCLIIQLKQPRVQEVRNLLEKVISREKVIEHSNLITGDVRQSIQAVLYNSAGYTESSIFDMVKQVFMRGDVSNVSKPEDYLWLIGNAHKFYSGFALYQVIQAIEIASQSGHPEILQTIPRGKGYPVQPYFFKRVRVRTQKKET